MSHPFVPSPDTTLTGICDRCAFPRTNRRMHTITMPPPVGRRTPPIDSLPTTGLHHPTTSHLAAASVVPTLGATKARILGYIADRPAAAGATADEVQQALDGTHQSVSAAINGLMVTGLVTTLIIDGKPVQRRTRSGRWAGAWRLTPLGSQALGRVLGVVR